MRKYELTLVLDDKATAARKKLLSEKVTKLIKELGGKVEKEEDWGEKGAGQLLHFLLELESASTKDLAVKLRGEEGVKKYLLINLIDLRFRNE